MSPSGVVIGEKIILWIHPSKTMMWRVKLVNGEDEEMCSRISAPPSFANLSALLSARADILLESCDAVSIICTLEDTRVIFT